DDVIHWLTLSVRTLPCDCHGLAVLSHDSGEGLNHLPVLLVGPYGCPRVNSLQCDGVSELRSCEGRILAVEIGCVHRRRARAVRIDELSCYFLALTGGFHFHGQALWWRTWIILRLSCIHLPRANSGIGCLS